MKTFFECLPCILNQAIVTLNLCRASDEVKKKSINDLIKRFKNIDYDASPCENTDAAYEIVSKEMLNAFRSADLIISKGQGNFETLDEISAPVYFLLKAKCKAIAEQLGVNYLDAIFMKSKSFSGKFKE